MANRLKLMRKVKHKTQQEIANYIGITQNAYSYWENDKVHIDNNSLSKLATYYNVSLDFLSGRKFIVTHPVSNWYNDLQEDYHNADAYLREYMEYRYGKAIFEDQEEKPAENSELVENTIIWHRDGRTERKQLTKEQMDMIAAMLKSIPDTPKDI